MVEDKNKGITVVYNYLNLPIQVNFGPNDRIDWTYTATGAKLQKKVYTNGSLTLTQDYVSGFVYKNGSLDFFSTETGRVKNQSGTLKYQYTLSDHLGNTRVMFEETSGTPTVIEESHYYAFGMRIEGLSTSSPDNKFTYNGKELEDDHGLNWYHYGARFYDAQIGRWHVVDLVDEFHSPYTFVGNNPIKSTDKDGMWEDPTTIAESMVGKYKYGNAQEYSWKISEWADKSPQLQCNQLVVVAFRKAGYGDMPRDRGGMRDWFKANGEVYVQPWTIENKLGWRNLERNDVVNWGGYDDNEGHVIIIASSLVKEKMGDKEVEGYWVVEACLS